MAGHPRALGLMAQATDPQHRVGSRALPAVHAVTSELASPKPASSSGKHSGSCTCSQLTEGAHGHVARRQPQQGQPHLVRLVTLHSPALCRGGGLERGAPRPASEALPVDCGQEPLAVRQGPWGPILEARSHRLFPFVTSGGRAHRDTEISQPGWWSRAPSLPCTLGWATPPWLAPRDGH